jgi:hypothetical protein
MEKYEDILKSMDVLLEDLTDEQKRELQKIAENIPNPNNMTPDQAMDIVKKLNLDIESLQKKAKKIRLENYNKNKKIKIKPNEKCSCGSDKKYKKCCIWKN